MNSALALDEADIRRHPVRIRIKGLRSEREVRFWHEGNQLTWERPLLPPLRLEGALLLRSRFR